MTNLQEKQRQRYLVLSKLYELTDGEPVRRIEADELREATGLTEVTFHDAVQYLRGEGLLKTSNLVLELTHEGLVEYERSLEKPDVPTEHFPVQVIQQFNAPVGAVQTGTHATANVVQNIGSSAGMVLELLAQLRRDIETTLPPAEQVEALELVEGIEEEARSEKPRTTRVKAFLKGLGNFALSTASNALATAIAQQFGLPPH
ncbi:MAG: hypothetical protein LC802_12485 [Acidobacteria bacterium]|nr:hypothetical protein [Acidobacteriota bacterium]